MSEIVLFYILVSIGVFLCACSQLLLKKSAEKVHYSLIASILNWRVIVAYGIFFCSLLMNITAMQHGVELKCMPIIESLGYIFVPLLSFFVLKERLDIRVLSSMMLIIVGVFVFYL